MCEPNKKKLDVQKKDIKFYNYAIHYMVLLLKVLLFVSYNDIQREGPFVKFFR